MWFTWANDLTAFLAKGLLCQHDDIKRAAEKVAKKAIRPFNKAKHFAKSKKKRTRKKYEKIYQAFAGGGFR